MLKKEFKIVNIYFIKLINSHYLNASKKSPQLMIYLSVERDK